jgi:amino acid adenylation domain-containing protein
MSTVSSQLVNLTPEEKRAILAQLLRNKAGQVRTVPLSFAQQRLWFLDQLEPGNASYNMRAAVQLSGALDVAVMAATLDEIVRRHETLRTTIRVQDSQPVQVVAPTLTLPLPLIDLSDWDEESRQRETKRFITQETSRPFDLAEGPLVRAGLVKLGPTEHVLVLTMHHIISDGWSRGVLVRELAALYGAFTAGKASPLPKLPFQYGDYAAWQRNWLQGQLLDEMVSYWKEQLKDLTPLALPTDRPRPAVQRYLGAKRRVVLPPALSEKLWTLSRSQGVTPFMTLLAAFNVLLHRYSGQDDIAIGSPIANRKRAEIEPMIGFFVNTLVLRTDLAGDPTFRELLGRVRQVCQGAYAHQDLPFAKLVEELQPQRELNRSPLYQVMFVLQNAPKPPLEVPSLVLNHLELDSTTAKADLLLTVGGRSNQRRWMSMEYNTDLFDEATIGRMLGHFQNLLEGIAANPNARLSALPLLSEAERRQVVQEWNDTATVYPQRHVLHELLEAQVERTPDAVALDFEGQQLTYHELNARANQLAHHLRGLGVGPDTLVALCAERSLEMVVGLWAILKAGGAYLPLDPEYPKDRLAFMLEDAQVSVLLTQEHLLDRLPPHDAQVLCLDTDWPALAGQAKGNLSVPMTPEHLAYVIYTSGSTGRPKGAQIPHRGICNRLLWMQDAYRLSAADRVLQKTPYSFDVSVWEFFWPLLTGARLVIAKPGGHRDSAYLVRLIAEQQVTVLHFVPSMLQVFLEEPGLERCTSLRHVVCSGEALPWELQKRFYGRLSANLHNLYGPTEASVDVTSWACERWSDLGVVPIGRPIANTQMYVLDRYLQPVPPGIPGELHIGGVGLARGYLKRPELTAEKFIPDPFGAAGARLYKTGDMARWRSDGSLEYLGRLDHQVKIRGFRIELGEIEAVLGQHAGVREAVVLAREDGPAGKHLVAYIVARQAEAAPTANELRGLLKEKLPEYMVPGAFVFLEAMPLTASGKVNRRALPAPEIGAGAAATEYVAPRTPLEELIAGLWAEVLGVERVGVHDNFFALGGHSLLATQLVSRVRGHFAVELPLRNLFETPTVAGLAERIEAQQLVTEAAQAARALSHVASADRDEGEL